MTDRWTSILAAGALAAAGLAVAACGSESAEPAAQQADASETEAATTSVDRIGATLTEAGLGEWRLVSISDAVLVPPDIVATIRFEGDEFSGQAPCNRYFGSRNTNPNVPGLLGPVGATRMMCPDEQMLYEDQYFEALAGVRDARIEGDRLILDWENDDESGKLVFVRVIAEP